MRFSVCLLLAQAAITGVPDKPDFSGKWVLVAAQPTDGDVALGLTVTQSVRRTNARGEPMTPYYDQIAIQRESSGDATSESHLLGLAGGTVSGVPNGIQRATHEEAVWRDSSLVFEQGTYAGTARGMGDWTERRETWTLEPNGELKVTIATNGSAETPRTVTATYRKANREAQTHGQKADAASLMFLRAASTCRRLACDSTRRDQDPVVVLID